MDSGLKSISSLFDGAKKLIIPVYQRNYAWEKLQWKDFWEDVFYHSSNQKYFFGTILLKEANKEGDFELLEIVDGQQRIITTTIFIYCLLEKLKLINPEKDLKFKVDKYIEYYGVHKLKLSDLDNEFFQTYILKENEIINCNTPSQTKLIEAKKYFHDNLEILTEFELDKMLSMIESAEILVYSVKNSAEATLIFETTNDRGKDLTILEKIKSFLMYRAYLSAGENASDLIDRIHSRFGDIYRILERIKPIFNERGILEVSEDQICQYHYVAEYPWNNKYEYQDFLNTFKNELNHLWYNNKHDEIVTFIEDYTNSLKESFIAFENILNYDNKFLNDIIYIGKIAMFFPILIYAYKIDDNENHEKFNKLLQKIEKLSSRMYFYNLYRKSDLTYPMNVIANNLSQKKDFENLYERIEYRTTLSSPIDTTLKTNNLYNVISNKALNYLFWKYENYLRTNFQPISNEMSYHEFNDKSGKYRITIEHITAQKPLNDLEFEERTEEFEEVYLHSLGNLTIAPQSSNSSMGNELWETKNKYYFQKAPFKTQLILSDYVDDYEKKWNKDAISKRRKDIIDFAIKYWGTNEENEKYNSDQNEDIEELIEDNDNGNE